MQTSPDFEPVLQTIWAEHQSWLDFVCELSPQLLLLARNGSGRVLPNQRFGLPSGSALPNWSTLETLIHVSAWQANVLEVARRIEAGQITKIAPSHTACGLLKIDLAAFNAEILDSHRTWTLTQALTWKNQTLTELCHLLPELPAETLFGGRHLCGACNWYFMPTVKHSRNHRREAQKMLGLPCT